METRGKQGELEGLEDGREAERSKQAEMGR